MGECCSRDSTQKPPVDKPKRKAKSPRQTSEAKAVQPAKTTSKLEAADDNEEPQFESTQEDEIPKNIKKDYKVKMRQGERSKTSKVTVRSFYDVGGGYAVLDSAYK
jgi:hypothetical protein